MLTAEYSEEGQEVAICFDTEGLGLLVAALNRIPEGDHCHLMTATWGGAELDEQAIGNGTTLIHHLRLVRRRSP